MNIIFSHLTNSCRPHVGSGLLLGVTLVLMGCAKSVDFGPRSGQSYFEPGEPIVFSAVCAPVTLGTKAEYYLSSTSGGDWYNGIKFNIDDHLSIFCRQAQKKDHGVSVQPLAEYKVIAPAATLPGENYAQIYRASDDDDNPLALDWGNAGEYLFQAAYPVVGTVVGSQSLMVFSSHEDAHFWYIFTLPAEQYYLNYVFHSDTKIHEFTPHMEYLLLAATKTVHSNNAADFGITEDGQKKAVFLNFVPQMTALHFTLENHYNDNAAMKPQYITVESTSSALTGVVKTAQRSSDLENESLTNTGRSVTMHFPSDLVVDNGDKMQFTLFFMGTNNATNLTLRFKDRDRTKVKTLQIKKTNNEYLTFNAKTKSYLHGILVEDDQSVHWDVAFDATAAWWLHNYKEVPLQPE